MTHHALWRHGRRPSWHICKPEGWRLLLPDTDKRIATSRVVWYCVHGRDSLPDTMDLRFIDGNNRNCRPDNLAHVVTDVTAGLRPAPGAAFRRFKVDGHAVLIDATDLDDLKARGLTIGWHVQPRSRRLYLMARPLRKKASKPISVAQLIVAPLPGHVIRYRNGNPLDVRRRNLDVRHHPRRTPRSLATLANLLHPNDTTAQIRMHMDAMDRHAAEHPEPATGDLDNFAADLDALLSETVA